MAKTDTAIDPKPIISLMFAVSIGFWANQLVQYQLKLSAVSLITFVSAFLFLLDLLCIVWWYARYIYRVQTKPSFGTYFLDFVICGMFALAANGWTKPITFLFATLFASALLIWRFQRLYKSPSASSTDKQILSTAFKALCIALVIAVIGTMAGITIAFLADVPKIHIVKPVLPILVGTLSAIGIILTLCLKSKIEVAVAIYAAKHGPFSPSYLQWTTTGPPDEQQRKRIRQRVKKGLRNFNNMFFVSEKHDRIHSRVHSETELRTQSYILALPSCEKQDYAEEIEWKAFMVAVSHWLDDLVDGRSEVHVWKQLQNGPALSDKNKEAKKLFEQIYQPLITEHTDDDFYVRLCERIDDSCLFKYNLRYMFLGLNRVACGSAIFSPKLTLDQRKYILHMHNNFLKAWNIEEKGDLEKEVERIIDKISVADEAGPILLGLTTKTVQEIAMSSEKDELNVGLSILLSILYAPLIYYHNIWQELANDEMVPLEAFDTDSDLWIPWLRRTRKAINKYDNSERRQVRIKQMEMAYRCFEPMLPKHIKPELSEIYLGKDAIGFEAEETYERVPKSEFKKAVELLQKDKQKPVEIKELPAKTKAKKKQVINGSVTEHKKS